jgi:hypothetical protein
VLPDFEAASASGTPRRLMSPLPAGMRTGIGNDRAQHSCANTGYWRILLLMLPTFGAEAPFLVQSGFLVQSHCKGGQPERDSAAWKDESMHTTRLAEIITLMKNSVLRKSASSSSMSRVISSVPHPHQYACRGKTHDG